MTNLNTKMETLAQSIAKDKSLGIFEIAPIVNDRISEVIEVNFSNFKEVCEISKTIVTMTFFYRQAK